MFGTVVKPILLATLFWNVLKENGFSNIIFGNVVNTNGFSNIIFEHVLKPMVLATLILTCIYVCVKAQVHAPLVYYICIDRRLRRNWMDANASNCIDPGSDHPAVWVQLKLKKLRADGGVATAGAEKYHCQIQEKRGDIDRSVRLERTAAEHKRSILEQQIRHSGNVQIS